MDQQEPFDVLIAGPNSGLSNLSPSVVPSSLNFFRHYTTDRPAEADIAEYLNNVRPELLAAKVPLKLFWGVNLDHYGMSQSQIDAIDAGGFRFIGPNSQMLRRRDDWGHTNERHYARKWNRLSDALYERVSQDPGWVIPLTHFIDFGEVVDTGIGNRKYGVAIPGAEYYYRKEAIKILRKEGIRFASKGYFHAYRVLDRIGVRPYSRPLLQRLFNALYFQSLANSKAVYTASGGSGNIPRKYFEIPASGSCLICVPCNGMADLGFIADENFVSAEPHQLPAKLKQLSIEEMSEIAFAGQRLVIKNHSTLARAQQLKKTITRLLDGNYKGATWREGELILTPGI